MQKTTQNSLIKCFYIFDSGVVCLVCESEIILGVNLQNSIENHLRELIH